MYYSHLVRQWWTEQDGSGKFIFRRIIIMPVNLAAVELRLLVVFDAVMAEGSVTRAAERLGMSQPAVSNALNRLRLMFNDSLFVRTGDGMRPTPKAVELAGPIQSAMRQLESALEPENFEPVDARWSFTLSVSDHASVVLLPHLVEHMARVAPRVELTIQSTLSSEVPAALDSTEIDIAIGVTDDLPKRFERLALFEDTYVCMMRREHPLAGRPITLQEFVEADHLIVKPGPGGTGRADRLLARQGIRRRSAMSVHQFLAAPAIVSRSDLLVLVYEKITPIFDPRRFYFCPVPVPGMQVTATAVWNRARSEHAAHRWMRRQLAQVARLLENAEGPEFCPTGEGGE
jgi:DNA-binding transcriptional LysR family regulator